ncbi:MAG TPA: hypothetical protein VFE24_08640 [Pirellulales bacterium]|jgi:hypothetical protein|nr:hypothetical protein [Pirellulales bacterium]
MRILAVIAVGGLTLCGCNQNQAALNALPNGNPAGAQLDPRNPGAQELDQALNRRPPLHEQDPQQAERDRRQQEPKTWLGRSVLGLLGNGEGISTADQDKMRDYIMANDEYLSQHLEPPLLTIRRANERVCIPRVGLPPPLVKPADPAAILNGDSGSTD